MINEIIVYTNFQPFYIEMKAKQPLLLTIATYILYL